MRDFIKQKVLWVAAFGYFVDLFDLVLYGAVRVESLKSIGYQGNDLFQVGALLLNIQMAGMVVGGVFWGLMGDKQGRKDALFGSIFIYSLATFLNGYIHDFSGYASLRFLAGFGLAGELGAAITLVSESLPQKNRGMGSAMVAAIGFMGAVTSSLVSQMMSWQNAYRLGGALGFILLLTRVSIRDSSLFLVSKTKSNLEQFGSFRIFLSSKRLMKLMGFSFLAGVPIWYTAGILSYFAPEFANALQITGGATAGTTIMMGYAGSILGDIACGLLSQKLKSRKKAVLTFLSLAVIITLFHPLVLFQASAVGFYLVRFIIGFTNGYFAIMIAWIAEMVGTNLRATMTSMVANFIRAAVIPLTLGFQQLNPRMGLLGASALLGGICYGLAIFSVTKLPETFSRDLKYLEKEGT